VGQVGGYYGHHARHAGGRGGPVALSRERLKTEKSLKAANTGAGTGNSMLIKTLKADSRKFLKHRKGLTTRLQAYLFPIKWNYF